MEGGGGERRRGEEGRGEREREKLRAAGAQAHTEERVEGSEATL